MRADLIQDPSKAHVCNLGRAVSSEQDIVRLQIKVDDGRAAGVQEMKPACYVERDLVAPHTPCKYWSGHARLAERMPQVTPCKKLGHKHHSPTAHTGALSGHDDSMIREGRHVPGV